MTSHFPAQLVTLASFLTASSRSRSSLYINFVNWFTWRSDGLVHSDSIFLLKPSKLSLILLFSIGMFTVMFSPRVLLDKIQWVINCSARLICKTSKSAYTTPLVAFNSRILYKTALTCFHTVSGTAPPYLFELLHLSYSPFRSLRSALDTRIFRVPRMGGRTLRERSSQKTSDLFSGTPFLSVRTPLHFFQAKHPPLLFCILICL